MDKYQRIKIAIARLYGLLPNQVEGLFLSGELDLGDTLALIEIMKYERPELVEFIYADDIQKQKEVDAQIKNIDFIISMLMKEYNKTTDPKEKEEQLKDIRAYQEAKDGLL